MTVDVAGHLEDLLAERREALRGPLGRNAAYMADLDAEIADCRRAVVAVEVTALALERAAADGKLQG